MIYQVPIAVGSSLGCIRCLTDRGSRGPMRGKTDTRTIVMITSRENDGEEVKNQEVKNHTQDQIVPATTASVCILPTVRRNRPKSVAKQS